MILILKFKKHLWRKISFEIVQKKHIGGSRTIVIENGPIPIGNNFWFFILDRERQTTSIVGDIKESLEDCYVPAGILIEFATACGLLI